jgi:hypothetical protein
MQKLLFKNEGANPQALLLVSAMLTGCSLLITWAAEYLANEVLLLY